MAKTETKFEKMLFFMHISDLCSSLGCFWYFLLFPVDHIFCVGLGSFIDVHIILIQFSMFPSTCIVFTTCAAATTNRYPLSLSARNTFYVISLIITKDIYNSRQNKRFFRVLLQFSISPKYRSIEIVIKKRRLCTELHNFSMHLIPCQFA